MTDAFAPWIMQTLPSQNGKLRAVAAQRSGNRTLVLKCDDPGDSSIYIHIVSGEILEPSYADRPLEYSLDDKPYIEHDWTYMEGDIAQFYAPYVRELTDGLRSARELRVRAYRSNGTPVEFVFNVEGGAAAVAFVQRGCADPGLYGLNDQETLALRSMAESIKR